MPQNMHDAKIIILYKNKDARSDSNNHTTITLIGIAGKYFVHLVSREGLFAIFSKSGYPPCLFTMVKSFHTKTKATVQYDGKVSESFTIKSGEKQGCVLAPTIFGIFFSMLLKAHFVVINCRS